MADKTVKLNGLVKVTLTKQQATWLYELLAERFDEGASTGLDEQNCSQIGDKLDVELGKVS